MGWVLLKPKPALGFILKTQTQPYYFMGRLKLAPLGLGQAGYPRVRYFFPSLTISLNLLHLWPKLVIDKRWREVKG